MIMAARGGGTREGALRGEVAGRPRITTRATPTILAAARLLRLPFLEEEHPCLEGSHAGVRDPLRKDAEPIIWGPRKAEQLGQTQTRRTGGGGAEGCRAGRRGRQALDVGGSHRQPGEGGDRGNSWGGDRASPRRASVNGSQPGVDLHLVRQQAQALERTGRLQPLGELEDEGRDRIQAVDARGGRKKGAGRANEATGGRNRGTTDKRRVQLRGDRAPLQRLRGGEQLRHTLALIGRDARERGEGVGDHILEGAQGPGDQVEGEIVVRGTARRAGGGRRGRVTGVEDAREGSGDREDLAIALDPDRVRVVVQDARLHRTLDASLAHGEGGGRKCAGAGINVHWGGQLDNAGGAAGQSGEEEGRGRARGRQGRWGSGDSRPLGDVPLVLQLVLLLRLERVGELGWDVERGRTGERRQGRGRQLATAGTAAHLGGRRLGGRGWHGCPIGRRGLRKLPGRGRVAPRDGAAVGEVCRCDRRGSRARRGSRRHPLHGLAHDLIRDQGGEVIQEGKRGPLAVELSPSVLQA